LLAMFRLAVFNVGFHNRDDHAKNFAFLMSESGEWRLAPAFDLSWSRVPGGEYTTSVLGEGKEPTMGKLIELAQRQGLSGKLAQEIVLEVQDGKKFMSELLQHFKVKNHPIFHILKEKRG
jgi:serine/threonine-protein kinase HipA